MPVPAPTVTTSRSTTLADRVDLKNLPLASTPAGHAFAMKCLHPADHEIKSTRAPGGFLPSVSISCDMLETVPWPEGALFCLIAQQANPLVPLSISFFGEGNAAVENYLWFNSAIGLRGLTKGIAGNWSNYQAGIGEFVRSITSYRVNAQSVTMDFVAPAVANQGTILSCQTCVKPRTISPASYTSSDTTITSVRALCDFWLYPTYDFNQAQMLMGTNAYTSHAIEGFYQPLKMGDMRLRNAQDIYIPMDASYLENQDDDVSYNCNGRLGTFPINFRNMAFTFSDSGLLKPTSSTVGLTWISGVNATGVSLRLRFRQVLEVYPKLGTLYSPMTEAPYPPDDLSYRMIREISGRMKDAYPASYNDLGKLKSIIKSIGHTVLKFADPFFDVLSAVPGVPGTIGAAGKAVLTAGKVIHKASKKKKKKQKQASEPQGRKFRPAPQGAKAITSGEGARRITIVRKAK